MNNSDLQQKIKDIVSIVETCPKHLQEKCFELLFLETISSKTKVSPEKNNIEKVQEVEDEQKEQQKVVESDIKIQDIHVKARKLLEKGITLEQLNNIFYKENEEFRPVYDHLKTTKATESQIRLALLEALKSGLKSGDFTADGKVVREQCEVYKCYDAANFAANFKKYADLFIEEYSKNKILSLSPKGKEKLIEVVKDLAA